MRLGEFVKLVSKRLASLSLGIFLAACSTTQQREPSALDKAVEPLIAESRGEVVAGPAVIAGFAGEPAPSGVTERRDYMYPGTDQVVSLKLRPVSDDKFEDTGDGVTLNFNGTPLPEVVKTVLGDILGQNYTIEPGLGGQVTLVTSRPVRRDALPSILDSLLQANGAALVRDPTGIYRVGPRPLLKGLAEVGAASATIPGYSVRVVPLQYIGAAEMGKILESLAPAESILRIDAQRNLIIVGGSRQELANILQTVDTFDVNLLKGMSVGIFAVDNVSASTIAASLESLFGPQGESPMSGIFRIIPLDGAGRVLVVTSRSKYLKEIGTWIKRLDFDDGASSRLYVFPVQNGDAERLAALLSQLFGTGGKAAPRPRGDVAPGQSAMTLRSGGEGGEGGAGGAGSVTPRTGGVASRGGGGASAVSLEGFSESGSEVRVVADTDNNTLLIMASADDYIAIENALRRLDTQPLQVLIEASIVEVTLTDELEYGLQWYFDNKAGDYTSTTQLDTQLPAGIGPKVPGFSWALTDASGLVKTVFNALAKDSRLRVISSPSVLVLDNRTAQIRVGDQQPVATSETVNTSATNVVTQNIEYKDTGVLLEVTPSVNAGGLVLMDVAQEVTDVGSIDAATGQRTFLQRNINSSVAVQSGETIVLGGLIKDNVSEGDTGLPFLHKLPGIGWLFGTKERSGNRTELLITLTPRAIRSMSEANQVGEEMRLRMQRLLEEMEPRRRFGAARYN